MKVCPNCQNKYPDDGNFCPREGCATAEGPRRLVMATASPAVGQGIGQEAVQEPGQRFAPTVRLGGSLSGEVWQARDNQTGETVAYKVVATPALPSPVAVDRAQRELKQLLRTQSARIAKLIDYGKAADGRLFIATELCPGEPLDRLVGRTGPMPLDRAKKIIGQIGDALLEAQKVGVVHHDLAPKNILIDADDQLKVINFTIPRPLGDKIFGVPEFLSPEQAEGKLGDQRSNTYSLGALTTFLLTGAPPFSGANAHAVLEQVIRGEVPPPSQRRPELTPEIDRVILKAMDKSSSRRPLTMRQFLNDVAAMHLGGAPAPAPRGLAKTMMYAGGAPEVRRLVAEATAARAEANGSGPVVAYSPVPAGSGAPAVHAAPAAAAARVVDPNATPAPPVMKAPVDSASQPTPPPVAVAARGHGAAVAATMVALPASPPAALGVPAPAPVAADEGPAQARAAAAGQGANFRETLWFKKGDVEQMVAEAKAKAAATLAPRGRAEAPAHGELPAEDAKPLEDRYLDDGSVTVEDRKKFSLRSGGTATGVPVVAGPATGERMTESEMLNEIGGGKRVKVIAIAAVAIAVVVAVLVFTLKGKPTEKPAAPPAASVELKAPEPPPAAAPPVPKAPPAPTEAATAVAGEEGDGEPAQAGPVKESPPIAKARSPKRKAAAKRNAGKKRH